MGVTTFDTLKFVRRLEDAGVPSDQAEVQAEVLTEAFNVNLNELVTKDYLSAQFADQKAYVDKRFAESKADTDRQFAERKADTDRQFAERKADTDRQFAERKADTLKQFAEQRAYMDKRFAEINTRFAEQNAKFTLLYWMLGLVVAATVIPLLQDLAAL